MELPETARGDALETIDQFGERHFRRIFHEQMDVVILSIGFDKSRLKVLADALKESTKCLMGGFRQDFPTILGHKDQVDV